MGYVSAIISQHPTGLWRPPQLVHMHAGCVCEHVWSSMCCMSLAVPALLVVNGRALSSVDTHGVRYMDGAQ